MCARSHQTAVKNFEFYCLLLLYYFLYIEPKLMKTVLLAICECRRELSMSALI
jgi:hypothetical protein